MNPSGLYVHLPFCVQKCPYCGFYSEAGADIDLIDRYLQAALYEITLLGNIAIDTIYIGGGTPSSIGASRLHWFISELLKSIHYMNIEMTIEANPESVNNEIVAAINDLPITRVSMGVQSLNEQTLQLLGRPHNARQAITAYENLRINCRTAINLDIIYDIPTVDCISIYQSLNQIITLKPEHISAYSYSPDTGYLTNVPSDDPNQTETINSMLAERGYRRYEISNFAISGFMALHNIKYWRMEDYIGIGAGAHSMVHLNGIRTRYNHKSDMKNYVVDPLHRNEIETYTPEDAAKESVIFGLRQIRGVDLAQIEAQNGYYFDNKFVAKCNQLVEDGLLEHHDQYLRATPKGLLLLNQVIAYLY